MTARDALLVALSADAGVRPALLDWALENGDALLAAALSEPDPAGGSSRDTYDGFGGGGFGGGFGDGGSYGDGGGDGGGDGVGLGGRDGGGDGGYGVERSHASRRFGSVRWGTR